MRAETPRADRCGSCRVFCIISLLPAPAIRTDARTHTHTHTHTPVCKVRASQSIEVQSNVKASRACKRALDSHLSSLSSFSLLIEAVLIRTCSNSIYRDYAVCSRKGDQRNYKRVSRRPFISLSPTLILPPLMLKCIYPRVSVCTSSSVCKCEENYFRKRAHATLAEEYAITSSNQSRLEIQSSFATCGEEKMPEQCESA